MGRLIAVVRLLSTLGECNFYYFSQVAHHAGSPNHQLIFFLALWFTAQSLFVPPEPNFGTSSLVPTVTQWLSQVMTLTWPWPTFHGHNPHFDHNQSFKHQKNPTIYQIDLSHKAIPWIQVLHVHWNSDLDLICKVSDLLLGKHAFACNSVNFHPIGMILSSIF